MAIPSVLLLILQMHMARYDGWKQLITGLKEVEFNCMAIPSVLLLILQMHHGEI